LWIWSFRVQTSPRARDKSYWELHKKCMMSDWINLGYYTSATRGAAQARWLALSPKVIW
jgi:hypothetical protein